MRKLALSLISAATVACGGVALAEPGDWGAAKFLFGRVDGASNQTPAAIGGYALGCMAGGAALEENGPTWQAMRLSRNRNWALPGTVDFAKELSAFAATQTGWEGLYIGDMSQPRGGPMLTGHRSHQSGLDLDIWMLPPDRLDLTVQERETLSSIPITNDFRTLNGNWTDGHYAILRHAAQDPRVARIFVTAPAKIEMCARETGDRSWLRKIRPWWGHYYHFHVRLNCPEGATGCVAQAPPPAGDGCDATLEWWVSDDALVPPEVEPRPSNAPPPRGRPEVRLAELPAQCTPVLLSD
jgi:penicillin-insensitive murein endopeptidase